MSAGDQERNCSHFQGERDGDFDPFSDPEEKRVIFAALDSFRQYRRTTHYNTTHRRRQNLYALPQSQWQLLASPPFSLLSTLNAVDDAVDANADIAEEILALGLQSLSLPQNPDKASPLYWHETATSNDLAKAHSTIRQFYRDWSAEGSAETSLITDTVLADLQTNLTDTKSQTIIPTVLLPGAGLARLLLTLCLDGYNTEGNEISYHQLLASNWILNHTRAANQHTLHPFATGFTNLLSRTQQLTSVTIPDIHPATAMSTAQQAGKRVGKMSMVAGDFISVYTSTDNTSKFDVVVTIFFIDTAPNLIRYIEAVRNCLKPGGLWINIGPLLWHFDDRVSGHQERAQQRRNDDETHPHSHPHTHQNPTTTPGIEAPGSFELTNDEVLFLLTYFNFHIEKSEILHQDTGVGMGYIQDPSSMLQNLYRCSHWVARRQETDGCP